jgi:hypothetical protein
MKTARTTQAERIAESFGDDGMRFHNEQGEHLDAVCEALAGRPSGATATARVTSTATPSRMGAQSLSRVTPGISRGPSLSPGRDCRPHDEEE